MILTNQLIIIAGVDDDDLESRIFLKKHILKKIFGVKGAAAVVGAPLAAAGIGTGAAVVGSTVGLATGLGAGAGLGLATAAVGTGIKGAFLLGSASILGPKVVNAIIFRNRFQNNGPPQNPLNGIKLAGLPPPIIRNPDFPNMLDTFDSCTAPGGEAGICAPGAACVLFAGRPSGSCIAGKVCCINTVTRCGGTVTLNNTYWQSPFSNTPSSCAISVRLNARDYTEQPKPICQLRFEKYFVFICISRQAINCT